MTELFILPLSASGSGKIACPKGYNFLFGLARPAETSFNFGMLTCKFLGPPTATAAGVICLTSFGV